MASFEEDGCFESVIIDVMQHVNPAFIGVEGCQQNVHASSEVTTCVLSTHLCLNISNRTHER